MARDAPSGLGGIWFGLTELVMTAKPRRTLYVAGTSTFDATDATGDWAVPDHAWSPEGRYVSLKGLAALPDHESSAVLRYAADLVCALAPQDDVDVAGIGVGFDDGDFLVVWART